MRQRVDWATFRKFLEEFSAVLVRCGRDLVIVQVGGRFVPKQLADERKLQLPSYPNADQIVKLE